MIDMQEFILELDRRNFGIASFNTYIHDGMNHCFIMITERGNTGKFLKEECCDCDLNFTLQKMLDDVSAAKCLLS